MGEPAQPRVLRRELPHHLLDEEIAEGDAGQPSLAVADGVEDGGVRVDVRIDFSEQQVRDRAGQPLAQRHLDEYERLVRQRGVKEAEAAPVRLQPPAQVVPVDDLVHRLVRDDLLEHERRGAPVDAMQVQESAVEPGAEHVHEVVVHELELRMSGEGVEQRDAHGEDVAGAVRSGVHQAQELLAPRLGRRGQGCRRLRVRVRPVAFERRFEACRLRAEVAAQELEERVPPVPIEHGERIERAPGECHHRRLALGAKQRVTELADVFARRRSGAPAEQPLPRRGEVPDDLLPECTSESHGGSSLSNGEP